MAAMWLKRVNRNLDSRTSEGHANAKMNRLFFAESHFEHQTSKDISLHARYGGSLEESPIFQNADSPSCSSNQMAFPGVGGSIPVNRSAVFVGDSMTWNKIKSRQPNVPLRGPT